MYGETDPRGVVTLLEALDEEFKLFTMSGGCFWDLGSGIGKIVFSVALSNFSFNLYGGVEFLNQLHETAFETYVSEWNGRGGEGVVQSLPRHKQHIKLQFENGDLFDLKNTWIEGYCSYYYHFMTYCLLIFSGLHWCYSVIVCSSPSI